MYLLFIACVIQREGKENIPWSTLLPEALLARGQLGEFPCLVVHLPKK